MHKPVRQVWSWVIREGSHGGGQETGLNSYRVPPRNRPTMTSSKEHLWKTLEDLTSDQFKQFKWLLKEDFPASRLEKADRQDTVDLLVQKYGCEEALRTSTLVLGKIYRNDLAQQLLKTNLKQTDKLENGPRIGNGVGSNGESAKQKARLDEMRTEISQKIKEREEKICEIQRSAELSRKSAERQTEESVLAFAGLVQLVEKSLSHLTEVIEYEQKATQKQAEEIIKDLQQEISELSRKEAELEHLLLTEDDEKFLQDVKTSNLTKISITKPSYSESVKTSVDKLKEALSEEMKKFYKKAKLIWMQQFAVEVTLDPLTAHPQLVISQDGKQVHCRATQPNFPDRPEDISVLGKDSLSSGSSYFEVEVGQKSSWDLGVIYRSIGRQGPTATGPGADLWKFSLRDGDGDNAAGVDLFQKAPVNKVGVYVNYEKGLVLFCDVDSGEMIRGFSKCSFKESLYPFFSFGGNNGHPNSDPLVISSP
ncbi:PREDICTED: pyrin-like [Cyprinodon variegatus]|uniref:Pyrin-like n=2 Tax=Cyprinodon variegatus TaxID=28743 RepID=A0A3Q2DQE3_CYPVA|nr:PREDICTED: pyrin-like [Cyprinodon variegatus]